MGNGEENKTGLDSCEPRQKLLLEEYKQLCEDWRLRDKYVLEKFIGSSVVFGLIGVVFGQVDDWFVQLGALFAGALFALIASIAVAKDIWYRDSTGKLLRRLEDALGISDGVRDVIRRQKSQPYDDDFEKSENGLEKHMKEDDIFSLRRVDIAAEKTTLNRMPCYLRCPALCFLAKQHTYDWILGFYLTICLVFVGLTGWVIYDRFWNGNGDSNSNTGQVQNSTGDGVSINIENTGIGSPNQSVTIDE